MTREDNIKIIREACIKANPENQDDSEDRSTILTIRLLFATACRAGEILGLQWDFIDDRAAEIVWPDSKTGGMRKPLNRRATVAPLPPSVPAFAGMMDFGDAGHFSATCQ